MEQKAIIKVITIAQRGVQALCRLNRQEKYYVPTHDIDRKIFCNTSWNTTEIAGAVTYKEMTTTTTFLNSLSGAPE